MRLVRRERCNWGGKSGGKKATLVEAITAEAQVVVAEATSIIYRWKSKLFYRSPFGVFVSWGRTVVVQETTKVARQLTSWSKSQQAEKRCRIEKKVRKKRQAERGRERKNTEWIQFEYFSFRFASAGHLMNIYQLLLPFVYLACNSVSDICVDILTCGEKIEQNIHADTSGQGRRRESLI